MLSFLLNFFAAASLASNADQARALAEKALAARGGPEKLLAIFRIKEQYSAGKTAKIPGTPRESVIELPRNWWIGRNERGEEPAKVAVRAWTLTILTDPGTSLEMLPDRTENAKTLSGIRVSGSVSPPLDMMFDKTNLELARIDWRNDIYRFSDWRNTGGIRYPAKCVMSRRATDEPWFHHEILAIERLKELPKGLKP